MPSAVRPWSAAAGAGAGRNGARPREHVVASGPMDFRSAGLCAGYSPEIFFPTTHGGKESKAEKLAKRVCAACPVLAVCAAWTEANPDLTAHGVWAGTSEIQRRKARFDRAAAQR